MSDTKQQVEEALLDVMRSHRSGIETGTLLNALQKRGFTRAEAQEVLRLFLDKGRLQLGPELRLELEAA